MNPYKEIWTKTGETIDYVINHGLDKRIVNLNFFIAGLVATLMRIEDLVPLGFSLGLVVFLVQVVLSGLIIKYILSYVYLLIGRIWKGKASLNQVILILSLALIPEIIYLIFISIGLAAKGEVVEINYLIAWVFSMRILVIGLSKIQNFNYGLAILNIVLPGFIAIVISTLWKML